MHAGGPGAGVGGQLDRFGGGCAGRGQPPPAQLDLGGHAKHKGQQSREEGVAGPLPEFGDQVCGTVELAGPA